TTGFGWAATGLTDDLRLAAFHPPIEEVFDVILSASPPSGFENQYQRKEVVRTQRGSPVSAWRRQVFGEGSPW
ncbi:MAG TPA: hypothetical protein VGR16_13775, partial [Thermomicrobiales bacterium]|nr:hypothetical protein [Thermomicrobiales bacterium]